MLGSHLLERDCGHIDSILGRVRLRHWPPSVQVSGGRDSIVLDRLGTRSIDAQGQRSRRSQRIRDLEKWLTAAPNPC